MTAKTDENRGRVMSHSTKPISHADFTCSCCGEVKVEPRLLEALEAMQTLAGRPIIIRDGYRCILRHLGMDGTTGSEHTQGKAADVGCPGLSLQQLYELAEQVPEFAHGGIGVYDDGFVHVDLRKHPARWARVRGQYVGIHHLVEPPARPFPTTKSA